MVDIPLGQPPPPLTQEQLRAVLLRLYGFSGDGVFRSNFDYVIDFDGTYYYANDAFQTVYGGLYWDEFPVDPDHSGSGNGVDGTDAGAVLLAAIGSGDVRIVGKSREETVLNVGVLAAPWLTIAAGISNVSIENLTIDGNAQAQTLIALTNDPTTSNIQFKNIRFTNFAAGVVAYTDATTDLNEDIVFQDCQFDNFTSPATTSLICIRATHVHIDHNKFVGDGSHGGYAVEVRYANDSLMEDNYVDGLGGGLMFWRWRATQTSHRNAMVNNVVKNTFGTADAYWSLFIQGGDSLIAFNTVSDVSRSAIIMQGSSDECNSIVCGNIIKNVAGGGETGSGAGIWIHGNATDDRAIGTIISGNTIENAFWGIVNNFSDESKIESNIVRLCQWQGIMITTQSLDCTIDNNTVWGNGAAGVPVDGSPGLGYVMAGIYIRGNNHQLIGNKAKNNYLNDVYIQNAADSTFIIGLDTRDSTAAAGITDNGIDTKIISSWNLSVFISSSGALGLSVIIPFVGSSGGSAGIGDRGFDIDANDEVTHTFFVVPEATSTLKAIRIYAKSNVAEADAMNAGVYVYGGGNNEPYTTFVLGWHDRPSITTNFANNDIIYWEIPEASLVGVTAGDCFDVRLIGRDANGANCATDCAARCVEVIYT